MTIINDEFKKGVGKRLRNLREKRGWTIDAVVEKLSNEYYADIDEKSVRRYENGTFLPKIDNLICIAELYDTTLDYIMYGKETSDDNSFTWYDTFKRLNRLIYPLAVGMGKSSADGKIYLELWDDEWKVYYERLQSYGLNKNYAFEHRGSEPSFDVKVLDELFADFINYKEQLAPTLARYNKYLESQGIDAEEFLKHRIEEIQSKQRK